MSISGSYDPRAGRGGLDAELARLRNQVDLSWAEERLLFTRLGLSDGMDVIDLGSGPGFFTERLLGLLPSSRITAVEVRPDLAEIAEERLVGAAGGRLQVLRRSILET